MFVFFTSDVNYVGAWRCYSKIISFQLFCFRILDSNGLKMIEPKAFAGLDKLIKM